jgi:hypothetical protein
MKNINKAYRDNILISTKNKCNKKISNILNHFNKIKIYKIKVNKIQVVSSKTRRLIIRIWRNI